MRFVLNNHYINFIVMFLHTGELEMHVPVKRLNYMNLWPLINHIVCEVLKYP